MSKRKLGILLLLSIACLVNTYGGSKKSKKSKEKVEAAAVQTADSTNGKYDYILVERVGGGDILFSLTTNGSDSIYADVARYRFRDTSFSLSYGKPDLEDSLYNSLNSILNGEKEIVRKDSTYNAKGFMMGTWMKCYAVKDTFKTEITDEAAKETIVEMEKNINIVTAAAKVIDEHLNSDQK